MRKHVLTYAVVSVLITVWAVATSSLQTAAKETDALQARLEGQATVWGYYRWNRSDERYFVNVAAVERLGVGRYKVLFAEPFADHQYVILANNTAGFVQVSQNTKESVMLLSRDQKGQPADAEVFFQVTADADQMRQTEIRVGPLDHAR